MLTRAALLFFCVLAVSLQAATTFEIKPDKVDGVYGPGETITWAVKVLVDKKPAEGSITFTQKDGGLEPGPKGTVALVDGAAKLTATRSTPGVVTMDVKYKGADGKEVGALGAAVVEPYKIQASMPPPDDFDAFWKSKIEELNAVPMNAQLTAVDIGNKDVEYSKITMDNIRGSKIQGQLAKPVGKTGLPAMLQVQYAGVYGLQKDWVTGPAKNGWLMLNISSHDLPIDEKPEFYKEQAAGPLKDYTRIGSDDREKSYFLRMFLSCYRAVEYLKNHPDWDKKTIVVIGGSQGGYQAIVTAGMHPSVTAFAANVPAGCDHTGKVAKRQPGWPNWGARGGVDAAKLSEVGRYFDAMNFATRAKCPGLIAWDWSTASARPKAFSRRTTNCRARRKSSSCPSPATAAKAPDTKRTTRCTAGFSKRSARNNPSPVIEGEGRGATSSSFFLTGNSRTGKSCIRLRKSAQSLHRFCSKNWNDCCDYPRWGATERQHLPPGECNMIATDLLIEQDVKWHEGGTIVLSLTGPLDSYTTDLLEARILKAMNDGARVLYLDMHGIDYISSAGAGAIINARGLALERGVDLRLVSPSLAVRELFRILGLSEILPFAG